MPNKIINTLLLMSALLLVSVVRSQDNISVTMKITAIQGLNLVGDKGLSSGIKKDMEFSIIRVSGSTENVIGSAKVVISKSTLSGLKINTVQAGEKVKIGDILKEKNETADMLSLLAETENLPDERVEQKSYWDTAKSAEKPEASTSQQNPGVKELQNKVQEMEKKDSHNSGLMTGIGICCGIYLIASVVVYTSQQNNQ